MGFRPGSVYVISPVNAETLGHLTKREVKEYLYENTVASTDGFTEAASVGRDSGDDGVTPVRARVHESPEEIEIVVAGGNGVWNAILGPMEGGPTTETVSLPDDWDELVDTYGSEIERDWGPHDR